MKKFMKNVYYLNDEKKNEKGYIIPNNMYD
jgi:hypothetical protein